MAACSIIIGSLFTCDGNIIKELKSGREAIVNPDTARWFGNVQRENWSRGTETIPHLFTNQISCQIICCWFDDELRNGFRLWHQTCKKIRHLKSARGSFFFDYSMNPGNILDAWIFWFQKESRRLACRRPERDAEFGWEWSRLRLTWNCKEFRHRLLFLNAVTGISIVFRRFPENKTRIKSGPIILKTVWFMPSASNKIRFSLPGFSIH